MSLPKTRDVTPERVQKAERFLNRLITEYENEGVVDAQTLERLRKMKQGFEMDCATVDLCGLLR